MRCINCAHVVPHLYTQTTPNLLKLTTCEKCNVIVDKYVEWEHFLLDVLLLRLPACRHLIFNTPTARLEFKFLLLVSISDAYYNWCVVESGVSWYSALSLHKPETPSPLINKSISKVILRNSDRYAILEAQFYNFLFISICLTAANILGCMLMFLILQKSLPFVDKSLNWRTALRTIALSRIANIFALVLYIWCRETTEGAVVIAFLKMYTLMSCLVFVKALVNHWFVAELVVSVGYLFEYIVSLIIS